MGTQTCFVIYANQKKSNDWMSIAIKQTKEEAEAFAREMMSKIPLLETYKIEETTYAGQMAQGQAESKQVQEISPKELKKRFESNDPSIHLIDVREDWEVAKNHIHGALHIKVKELPDQLINLSQDHEYIVYCAAGYRSLFTCEFLQEHGYLTGGMLGWEGLGFIVPILDKAMSLSSLLRKRQWEER